MTLHRKLNLKREKSKIILPLQIDTTLLPKKRKTIKNKKKTDKTKTGIYKKTKHNNKAKLNKYQKYPNRSEQSPYSSSLVI